MTANFGAVYTPDDYAYILAKWGIRSKNDIVLDLGVGMGVFLNQSLIRFEELGVDKKISQNQLFGAEIDTNVYKAFTNKSSQRDLFFPNIKNENFFNYDYPEIDVLLGNPPYIRRRNLSFEDYLYARDKTLHSNKFIHSNQLMHLSDMYVYFLLSSLPKLKIGGRLSIIIADTWLYTKYGNILKDYLLQNFIIENIISLDKRVFNNAQVKAVILLGTKSKKVEPYNIKFSRIKTKLSTNKLSAFIFNGIYNDKEIVIKNINNDELSVDESWGKYFKSFDFFNELINKKDIVVSVRDIAKVNIGIQTLAKRFFVINKDDKNKIENKFLKPFAYSISDFKNSHISKQTIPEKYVFYCNSSKDDLSNTKALDYINEGENKEVLVRGKGYSVIGYQSKNRIQKANRLFWYDLKTEIDNKKISQILLPRFINKKFFPLWNEEKFIPGGAVFQFFPYDSSIDSRVYLAILSSSFMELSFRINAQIYGGGTTNLKTSSIYDSSIINVNKLSNELKNSLIFAYTEYLKTKNNYQINILVYNILDLSKEQILQLEELLSELKMISVSS